MRAVKTPLIKYEYVFQNESYEMSHPLSLNSKNLIIDLGGMKITDFIKCYNRL